MTCEFRPPVWENSTGMFRVKRALDKVQKIREMFWSGRPDLNRRPPAPKAGALPGCATPRHELRQDYKGLPNRTVAPSDRSRPQVSCGIVRCEKIAKRPPSDSPEFLSRFHGWDTRG